MNQDEVDQIAALVKLMRGQKATATLKDLYQALDYLSREQLIELYNELVVRLASG